MFSATKPNVKALHELVLYFMRERESGNTGIKQLVITDGDAVFLFADAEFERLFWNKKRFRKALLALDADAGKNNPLVYERIERHVDELSADEELTVTVLHLHLFRTYCEDGDPETDERLLPLYKILSPVHLLRRPFAGDSNHLDKRFYRELLHLVGLEERPENPKKKSGKKVIARLPAGRRHEASLLENTLQVARKEQRFRKVAGFGSYGSNQEEREFAVALELCLTWVNRILFLKLLETQLVAYHGGGADYRFLTPARIPDYDALNTLFFDVLNRPVGEREAFVAEFARVPYLNSSLFEISNLEDEVIRVNSLKDQHGLPLAERSVLTGALTPGPSPKERGEVPPLEYLFRFLDAYDFGGEGRARIQEDNKRLINASVLGLIFEKINGYRDGSFYTPGFITEYMCRETIRRAVVQKFRDDTTDFASFGAGDFGDLRNYLSGKYQRSERLAANALVNTLTICDPAVGSGHFLVSALNELIATKSELGILGGDAGATDVGITAVVVNDELLLSYRRSGDPYEYHVETDGHGRHRVPPEVQAVQETVFAEKRTLIENCLFGVDLNPNSVKICRLRLWIELLKSAYYDGESGQLETLPNIDINIKQGNSLISRFALDDDLSGALGDSDLTLSDYRRAVTDYHRARGSESKAELLGLIERIKSNFETHIGRNDKRRKDLARARGKMDEARINVAAAERFGINDKSVTKDRKVIAKQTKTVAKLEAELASVENNTIYQNAFEWRFEFPAVLGEEGAYLGFDVVVGNPPYVGHDFITEKSYFRDRYDSYNSFTDLYCLFIELTSYIISLKGESSLIVSNSFLRSDYGKPLRDFLYSNTSILKLYDLKETKIFEDATVNVVILAVTRSKLEGPAKVVNRDFDLGANFFDFVVAHSFPYSQTDFDMDSWGLLSSSEISVMRKLNSVGLTLEARNTKIRLGIATGANDAFIISTEKSLQLQTESPKSAGIIKPILRGKEIERYSYSRSEDQIILLKNGVIGEDYPNIINYLHEFGDKFKARGAQGNKWYNLRAASFYDDFQSDYITWIELSDTNRFTIVTEEIYLLNSAYFLKAPEGILPKYLLSILNSKIALFFIRSIAATSGVGTIRWFNTYVKQIPIFDANLQTQEKLVSIVDQILHQKAQSPTADTSALEAEIDLLVYRLYGLTYAEVLVVDPEFGLEEEAYLATE